MKNIIIGVTALFCTCVTAQAQSWTGKASFYGARGLMTCAHRSLPFGTHVRVTNLRNKRSVVLVVNDRGPFIKGRIIDVSAAAADALGFRHAGLAPVEVTTLMD
ncbi:MAG: septal ring lytic transglycosylase RlpA family protein [Beijerinckiaceae bacterium]|nr:septal ring lytic transglycosylase RlpA family protein [Beijerinckiaceae bacterium]